MTGCQELHAPLTNSRRSTWKTSCDAGVLLSEANHETLTGALPTRPPSLSDTLTLVSVGAAASTISLAFAVALSTVASALAGPPAAGVKTAVALPGFDWIVVCCADSEPLTALLQVTARPVSAATCAAGSKVPLELSGRQP